MVAWFARADDPSEPTRLIFTPKYSGHVCFCMVPSQYAEPDHKLVREAFGVAYRLTIEGRMEELYRTEGWYSFNVFISDDGRYLIQMGPWNSGDEVSEKHLALAFHKDGKLLKRYSTAQMVKDPDRIEVSVSHYRWMAPGLHEKLTDGQREALWPRLDNDNKFTLHTLDGWTYVFDATTGEIISSAQRDR